MHFGYAAREQDLPSGANDLAGRAAELERQAEEQLILFELTANGYMQRLHRQLADSLRVEAAILRQQHSARRLR